MMVCGYKLDPALHPSSLHEQYSTRTEKVPDLVMHPDGDGFSSSIHPQERTTRGVTSFSTAERERERGREKMKGRKMKGGKNK